MIRAAMISAMLTLFVFTGLAGGQERGLIWVSPGGTGDGTQQSPLGSIQQAVDMAQPGGGVILTTGQYNENVVLAGSGTNGSPIHLSPAPDATPEIVVDQGEGIRVTGSHWIISGLTVTGINGSRENNYGYGILVEGREAGGHHITITENTVSGFSVGGIATNWTNHINVLNNRVFDNSNWGPEGGSGISLLELSNSGGNDAVNRIAGNVVYNNAQLVNSTKIGFNEITDGNCIQLDRLDFGTGAGQQAVVSNNVSYDCGGRGLNVFESSNVVLNNNITRHNGNTAALAAEVYVEGENVELRGNVLVPNPDRPAVVGSPTFDDSQILDSSASLEEALSCLPGEASAAATTAATTTTTSTSPPTTTPPQTFTQPDMPSTTLDLAAIPAGDFCPGPAAQAIGTVPLPQLPPLGSSELADDDWSVFDVFIAVVVLFMFCTLVIYSVLSDLRLAKSKRSK